MGRQSRFNSTTLTFCGSTLALVGLLGWTLAASGSAASPEKTKAGLEQRFTATVKPFMQAYCVACHGKDKPQAQLDLTAYPTMAAVVEGYPHWFLVMEKMAAKQMPPPGTQQPSAKQSEAVIQWIKDVRTFEANRNAGDPGPVLARRLSNSEYDYTIRDLTGVDLKPTKEFPVDPANQEGFDNSGESLTLSTGLMKKYVAAAKDVADHMALTSRGLEFYSSPILADTDRDKYCILRIVDYYKSQPTDVADYVQAAWKFKHRAELGMPEATLEKIAAQSKVSAKYLNLVWATLTGPSEKVGPIAKLQAMWNVMPAPDKTHPNVERMASVAVRDWVVAMRKKTAWWFPNLRVPGGFSDGGQCFVLWKDREYASHRRMLNPNNLQPGGELQTGATPAKKTRRNQKPNAPTTPDPELFIPKNEAERAPYIASFEKFCNVFPDAFYISERGRMFVDDPGDQGRLLTAGLHNSMGYFRDDTPLMELILDEKGQKNLNSLWLDFDMVAFVPERMHREFFHYERAEAGTTTGPEFDFVRAEDADATSDEKIKKYGEFYLAKAKKNGGEPDSITAIEDHFKWVSKTIRFTEKARLAAEPAHLASLVDFAQRAYRRPLTATEKTNLLAFYQTLRKKENLSHEDAIRDSIVTVLMSPKFLFRMDLESADASDKPLSKLRTASFVKRPAVAPPTAKPSKVEALPDYALASRLSYFLWSSMPDQELLNHAAVGDLHKPEVLTAQTRRMLKSPRVRALALEFGGNWLDFRRFEEHQAVDRERFPTFNDALRESMFEEPLHFLIDTFQNDRSILDMIYGKYTFVNTPLAQHYGMTDVKGTGADTWVRVDNADQFGRGGILPMAVFLTKNSPGLRTSPVKRGYWMVRRVLGEYIPPPPNNVPALPDDESKLGNLTLRQALAAHRENPACAGCHARFDSYGLVFEGYNPVGQVRTKDLGGKTVDAKAPFPGNVEKTGVTGLQEFIRQQRQKDFVDTLSRKLLSYALGRSLQPSDDPLLEQTNQKLVAKGYKFGTLVESIVTSKQFLYRRASASPSATTTRH